MLPSVLAPKERTGQRQRWLGGRRLLLWSLLAALVLALLGVLVFLAREYEENRAQTRLEQEALAMVAELRSGLQRNVQDLQATGGHWAEQGGPARVMEFLTQHREILNLEQRDASLNLQRQQVSPYMPYLFDAMSRSQSMADIRQACNNAHRYNAPAYAPSYFWPLKQGQGQELMEMCLPLVRDGREDGFLVATYSLNGVLSEMLRTEMRRRHSVALTEADGTRLSILGHIIGQRDVLRSTQLFDLPGAPYMLRVEFPREFRGWFPNVLTATVALLSLALLTVLWLLVRDVRRRQLAEGHLADALAFRKAMEDSLVTGLRARDMNGVISYVNPAFCQMVGRSAEELIGTGTPAPYWPPELLNEYQHRQTVRQAENDLPREGFESEFIRPDGVRIPVRIIEAPLMNDQGVQTGWMSAILDMREQRHMEELTRASQERLQATARLAMAGEMASLISHELNQPLAAIASYANGSLNLLHDAQPPSTAVLADIEEAIRRVAEQAERAGKVIRGVADLVRRREREREAVPVEALFEAVKPLLQLRARKAGIELHWDLAPQCPPVWCDRTMVEQVLLNLARNGIQAMPPGVPQASSGLRTLHLAAAPCPESSEGPKAGVMFSVTDHGQGLSSEAQRHLFTPFFTTKSNGMGLGLSLCRTVVEQHGGHLSFEPAAPSGMVFRFTLPAAV